MQSAFINQLKDLITSIYPNPKIDFRKTFNGDTQSDLIVLFDEEFDKIESKLIEFANQFKICKFPDSTISISRDPKIHHRKLYVFKFKLGPGYNKKFVFLKGVKEYETPIDDFEVLERESY